MDEKKLELMNTMIGNMSQLLELWHETQQDDKEDQRLCLNYPFEESFDETIARVQTWRDAYYYGKEQE